MSAADQSGVLCSAENGGTDSVWLKHWWLVSRAGWEQRVRGRAVHLILPWLQPQLFSIKLFSVLMLPSSWQTTAVLLWSRGLNWRIYDFSKHIKNPSTSCLYQCSAMGALIPNTVGHVSSNGVQQRKISFLFCGYQQIEQARDHPLALQPVAPGTSPTVWHSSLPQGSSLWSRMAVPNVPVGNEPWLSLSSKLCLGIAWESANWRGLHLCKGVWQQLSSHALALL